MKYDSASQGDVCVEARNLDAMTTVQIDGTYVLIIPLSLRV